MPARLRNVLVGMLFVLPYFALVHWAWGDLREFLAHPVRAALPWVMLVLAASVALAAPLERSTAVREDQGNRWVVLPLIILGFLLAWLPPYAERRGWGTLDGDIVRWTGLALLILGGTLRVVPMFVLGRRFSALVEVQKDHRLETRGVYGLIRHPSYLGGLVMLSGWCLCFRSLPGLLLLPFLLAVLVGRMNAEERLLEEEFGAEYTEYRRRTRRLIPFLY